MFRITKFLICICLTFSFFSSCQREERALNTLSLNFQEGDLPSLNPHALMIYLRGICISKNLYECLTRINAQGRAEMAGALSVDVSPDQRTYTFKLKDNHWSNGAPVTAYQYENAWKLALSPTSNCSRADLLYLIKNAVEAKKGAISLESVGVKAIDEKTLVVDLEYPSPQFLELVAQAICAPLLNLEEKEPTAFNGPFFVSEWKRGDYLKLKKNPYFWDAQHISLQEIDIFMVQDAMTGFAMYEKGQIDWVGVPLIALPAELIDSLEKSKKLKSHPIDRAFWVFLNTLHPQLSSVSIRQALSLAVDRNAIAKHILIGNHPLEKPLPVALLPLATSSSFEENVKQAQEKFELGLQEMGLTKETFPPLEITYSQQTGRKQVAEYLQQTWSKAFGINVFAVSQEWNVLRKNLETGHFQVSGCYEAAFYNDPIELMDKFTTQNPNNFSKWENVEFQEKVGTARRESDSNKRMQLLSDAEQILMDQMPFIPICSDQFMFSHPSNLKGYVFDYVGACDFSRASFSH